MPRRALRKLNLTDLYVRKLRPEAAAFVVWDTRQHGLALRVQPTGNRAWKAIYSRHGRPRWLHLGNADAIGLADARVLAAAAMLAVARGKDPAAEKKAERGKGTFEELATRYVEEHAKKHNKSWRQADALVRRHALPRWGKLQAATITRPDIKTMMAGIEAPIVANQTLAAVSAVFAWAAKEELVTVNPCRGIDRNATKSRERVLADSEIPQFWSAFDDAGLVAGSALRMILLSGQRPGEVAHMRREHIADGWWTLPGGPVPSLGWLGTKNGELHRVWLSAPVQAILAEMGDAASSGRSSPFSGRTGRAVRPAPAMTGNGPRKSDQRGGVIGHEATSATADVQDTAYGVRRATHRPRCSTTWSGRRRRARAERAGGIHAQMDGKVAFVRAQTSVFSSSRGD